MKLYKLAKLAIKSSFVLLILIFSNEVYEAYKMSRTPPFKIIVDSQSYSLYISTFDSETCIPINSVKAVSNRLAKSQIVAFEYEDTRGLILPIQSVFYYTPVGTGCFIQGNNRKVMIRIKPGEGKNITFDGFSPPSRHWLSFLFDKVFHVLTLEEIVNEYIPSGKWVSSEIPF